MDYIASDFARRVFSISEAGDHLRVSRSFVYKLIADKQLRPIKMGTRTLITGEEITRLIASKQSAV